MDNSLTPGQVIQLSLYNAVGFYGMLWYIISTPLCCGVSAQMGLVILLKKIDLLIINIYPPS